MKKTSTSMTKLVLPKEKDKPACVERRSPIHAVPSADSSTEFNTQPAMDDLPVLLAGPILRHADSKRVVVWVATSVDVEVHVRVLQTNKCPPDRWPKLCEGTGVRERLGARLFSTTVTVSLETGCFPRNTVLAYDLAFYASPEDRFTCEGGFTPRKEIAYDEKLPLPTFTLGVNERKAYFAHGSCRSLHETYDDDAMEVLDAHIKQNANNVNGRPSALLLTGDQIYADEVDDAIGKAIALVAEDVLGWSEPMPKGLVPPLTPKMPHAPPTAEVAHDYPPPLGGRNRHSLVRAHGFTTTRGENHLMTFGEFAAMYLLAWSPALWKYGKVSGVLEGHLIVKRNKLESIIATRRVLANVPSYMIMDDHDISDDWPLTKTQYDAVNNSLIGRWVVANGLAACCIFQLGKQLKEPLLHELRSYLQSGERATTSNEEVMEAFVQQRDGKYSQSMMDRYTPGAGDGLGLGFKALTTPPVVFLDTRTQRYLRKNQSPALMRDSAISAVLEELKKLPNDMPVLIVSPTPVIGLAAFQDPVRPHQHKNDEFFESNKDSVQENSSKHHNKAHPGKDKVKDKRDPEVWSYDVHSFHMLLTTLVQSRKTRFVIFSGDVHYGFAAKSEFLAMEEIQDPQNPTKDSGYVGRKIDIVQLTSSAMQKAIGPVNRVAMAVGHLIASGKHSPHAFYRTSKEKIVFHKVHERFRPTHSYPRPEPPPETVLATLDTNFYESSEGNDVVFKHNNVGIVEIAWPEGGDMTVTQMLIGPQKKGKETKVTIPLSRKS